MIKVELDYNPYLEETEIKFNGNMPRINSLVEKYTDSKLQTWIKKIPSIFYDEMNGFDFELLFSGTDLEFGELIDVFSKINEKVEQVKLIHIKKLESRDRKRERINDLIEWLCTEKNRNFDFDSFCREYKEQLVEDYHFIILYVDLQHSVILKNKKIKIDNILHIEELHNTNLTNMPILIFINRYVFDDLSNYLEQLLSRKDVNKEQLFFYIDPSFNINFVERTIEDLGISNPQIVKSIDDASILTFFDVYPITEHITKMIQVFEREYQKVKHSLDIENEHVAITNRELHDRINTLDHSLGLLEEAIQLLENRNQIYLISSSNSFDFLIQEFKDKLYKWSSRKTKLYSYAEAVEYSLELSQMIESWGEEFKNHLTIHECNLMNSIRSKCEEYYKKGESESDYSPETTFSEVKDVTFKNNINNELIELKEERWVIPGKGLIAQIFGSNDMEQEAQLQTAWMMDVWKEHIMLFVMPLMENMIKSSQKALIEYADALIYDYQNKLKEMVDSKITEKNNLISQLSKEERELENDYIWLNELKSRLIKIERE